MKATVVRIVYVYHVQVGVVDGRGQSAQSHLVVARRGQSLLVQGGLGGVEEGVDEGAFAGVFAAEDDKGAVIKLACGAGFV